MFLVGIGTAVGDLDLGLSACFEIFHHDFGAQG